MAKLIKKSILKKLKRLFPDKNIVVESQLRWYNKLDGDIEEVVAVYIEDFKYNEHYIHGWTPSGYNLEQTHEFLKQYVKDYE